VQRENQSPSLAGELAVRDHKLAPMNEAAAAAALQAAPAPDERRSISTPDEAQPLVTAAVSVAALTAAPAAWPRHPDEMSGAAISAAESDQPHQTGSAPQPEAIKPEGNAPGDATPAMTNARFAPGVTLAGEPRGETSMDDERHAEGGAVIAPGGELCPRSPRQYRPTSRAPGRPKPSSPEREIGSGRDRALSIEVRLIFERAGFCRLSLLPRRSPDLPEEITVAGSGDSQELIALQDDWYQDVVLADVATLLRQGVVWVGTLPEGRSARWSLSGREIWVLCRHHAISGFVSTSRLILGEQHVVLCTRERL